MVRMTFAAASVALTLTAFARYSPERAQVARRCAAQSIVLLKNDGVLPLAKGSSLAAVKPVDAAFMGCGRGSAWIHMPYVIDVPTGLADAGYRLDDRNRDVAVWTIVRNATEGRECDLDGYCLTAKEQAKLAELKQAGFRKIVVVLNVGTMISMEQLAKDDAVSAILYVSYPGMEGGHAIADVISGAVNPSGRLPVTVAKALEDYPSDATWQEGRHYVPYEEDVFVGYRYFATIPGACKQVTYPFGHGLSYTTFARSDARIARADGKVTVSVKVTNVGKVAGRHSVLAYSSVAGGRAQHPAKELRAFAKTALLAPGAAETLTMSFDEADLAYFDDEGSSGKLGSWAIDGGEYTVWVGGTPCDVEQAGSFALKPRILSTPGFKLNPAMLARRLRADGSYSETPALYGDKNGCRKDVKDVGERPGPDKLIRLQQVAKGEKTLDEFIDQMPFKDMAQLLVGQENILPVGNTRSIGVLKEYGVPGLQTADGPVGIRLGQYPKAGESPVPDQLSTAFPATALTAGSFDVALQEEYGRVVGAEAAEVGIDIHLAPGICLARHPMCGRNFEYMGEDPYLAGRMAAAYVRGVQSQGVSSTIKHFAGNNRENTRRESWDVVSERAMREIYLKGFEIAIKESAPKCVMTSYNAINGVWTGAQFGLIEGILRGEWGFDGLVMTDWHARSHLWQNVAAGNDVKMPDASAGGRTRGGLEELVDFVKQGRIDVRRFKQSVRRVLELVMASPRFKATVGADAPAAGGGALAPLALDSLPAGSIRPAGWLRWQLEAMTEGLQGRLYEHGKYLHRPNGWTKPDGKWGWEEQPYWLRSFLKLAILTGNERMLGVSREWIDGILSTVRDDGWFGPTELCTHRHDRTGKVISDIWPHMVMVETLLTWYEYAHDPRVLPALAGFARWCLAQPDDVFLKKDSVWTYEVQCGRACDLVPTLFRLYGLTDERTFLDLADRLFRMRQRTPDRTYLTIHNVNFAQRFAYETVFSRRSGNPSHRAFADYWYEINARLWGGEFPRGGFAADECQRVGCFDARYATESCCWGELVRSFRELANVTGEAKWCDRTEDVVFNWFPVCFTPDWKRVHYLTGANMVRVDAATDHNYMDPSPRIAYSAERYRCCQHNAALALPLFAENLTRVAPSGDLVFALYAPHEGRVGETAWKLETRYPFRETLVIEAKGLGARQVVLRVPGWAKGLAVTRNGAALDVPAPADGWLRLRGPWGETERFEVAFAAACVLTPHVRTHAVTVERGPLAYSLALGETYRDVPAPVFAEGNDGALVGEYPPEKEGERGERMTEVLPQRDWNYALVPGKGLDYRECAWTDDCFVASNATCEIVATGRKVPAWKLQDGQPAALQESPVATDAPEETLRFIPMGCARCRLTVLPVAARPGEIANVWHEVPATTRRADRPKLISQ